MLIVGVEVVIDSKGRTATTKKRKKKEQRRKLLAGRRRLWFEMGSSELARRVALIPQQGWGFKEMEGVMHDGVKAGRRDPELRDGQGKNSVAIQEGPLTIRVEAENALLVVDWVSLSLVGWSS